MLKLSQENFINVRDYVLANCDDISRAWFCYHFEGGNADAFMEVLANYQHECGGFGGLDYGFDYQGSCLKCTEYAIGYITRLAEKPLGNHPVIQKVMKYILARYRPTLGNWSEIVAPEVNNGVYLRHARYRGTHTATAEMEAYESQRHYFDTEDERIKRYEANEFVCFAAFVAYYPEIVPEELYTEIIKYPMQHILRYWDENSPEYDKTLFTDRGPYDFEYFQGFVHCLKDSDIKDRLAAILRQNPTAFMELDYAKSDNDYVHLPCDCVSSPDSIIYPVVKSLVDDSLAYRMKVQRADGSFPLGWSFGKSDELKRMEKLYEAHLTVEMLIKLKRFGRIEL